MPRMKNETVELAAMAADGPLPLLRLSPAGQLLYANAASMPLLEAWGVKVGADLCSRYREQIQTLLSGCPMVCWEEEAGKRCLRLVLSKSRQTSGLQLCATDVTEYRRQLDEYALAKDMAETANRAKSLFLSRMSHEIRTPLNNIMGLLHLVKQNPDPDRQRGYLHNMEKAGRHLMALVNNILDLSRIEAGKIELACEDFDLEKTLGNAVGVVAPQAAEKGLDIRLDLDFDIPRLLRGDPVHLSQVLVNLLSNALKFSPASSWIKLSSRLLSREEDSLRLQFTVTDCGAGIEPDKIQRIFEPFEQANSTIAQRFGGSGLGLSISRHIVELMGGDIRVQSTPNQGSAFTFDVVMRLSGTLTDISSPWDFQGRNVLLVSGDSYSRQYLLNMLNRKGAWASACVSGRELYQRVQEFTVRQHSLDLVLVGRKLADMHPVEAVRLVRRINSRCRIVMMTNPLEWEQMADEAREAGADTHIQLPILPSALQAVLNRCENPSTADVTAEVGSVFEGKSILIAEDNDLSRLMMHEVLSGTGVRITFAENGLQAVSRVVYEKQDYDLILMDLQMPEMGGLEAARIIRSRRKDIYIPILALTANAFADDMKSSIDSGMDGFLAKPLDIPKLLETMRSIFEAKATLEEEDKESPRSVMHLPSLDSAGGLRRLMGNQGLYRRMLRRTLEDNPADELCRHIGEGDHEAAVRDMHTLKGNAAMLGLLDVSAQAQSMEATLKQGEEQAAMDMLPALLTRLQTARSSIEQYLEGTAEV